MGNTIQIQIRVISKEQAEILIAELAEINFYAFVQEEDSFEEENGNSLFAFIKEEDFNEEELKKFISHKNLPYIKTIIKDINWNAKWEGEFEPILIEDFVAVRAAFHQLITNVTHNIIITPKMSFGTGHHATTFLMMQQMQHINFSNKTVLDYGTGTGILAILAKKLGAKKVVAIDNDEWSINNASENIIANNCKDIVVLQKNDLNGLEVFDIILANINLNVINNSIQQLKLISQPLSNLLLSGFFICDEEAILNNFISEGFIHINTMKRYEWISILLIKS
jgi:ribosomal protein L11 methyltransferase